MRGVWLLAAIFLGYTQLGFAIYGPSLTRADPAVSLRACQEAGFTHARQIARAMQSRSPSVSLSVLGDALQELHGTSSTAALYPARAFCVHELVPVSLAANSTRETRKLPTPEVSEFATLGLKYVYYEPDDRWVLRQNPVDLNELAAKYLGSRWGRQAFLMMTWLGWSQGSCQEGPDQFREVIAHGKSFLRVYPDTEVSDDIRLAMANAYETWWNLSLARNPPDGTAKKDGWTNNYVNGAKEAREAAIGLYRSYLAKQKVRQPGAIQDVQHRLKQLRDNPNGSNTYDYFCGDYED
jgi:hypothetical protein